MNFRSVRSKPQESSLSLSSFSHWHFLTKVFLFHSFFGSHWAWLMSKSFHRIQTLASEVAVDVAVNAAAAKCCGSVLTGFCCINIALDPVLEV